MIPPWVFRFVLAPIFIIMGLYALYRILRAAWRGKFWWEDEA